MKTAILVLDFTEQQAEDIRKLLDVDRVRGLTYTEKRQPIWFGIAGHSVKFTIHCPEHFADRLKQRLADWGREWQADWSW